MLGLRVRAHECLLGSGLLLLTLIHLVAPKLMKRNLQSFFVFNVLEMLRYEMVFDAKNASNIVVMFANLMR
ncbi:hypothetical protein ABD76_00015, partial [Paenibacillus dendritiformis]|nr:hypothetical protein [Paenibacillus dendritiformis]